MSMPEMDEEEVTGMSSECPFCKGIVRTNAANTVISHSRPECDRFEKMSPVAFFEAIKHAKPKSGEHVDTHGRTKSV